MKIKRQKRVQRILGFFKNNFGHREPYQILLDGTFCQSCLTNKINIREQIPKYIGSEVKLLTTSCCIREVEKLGSALYGAGLILKQFPLHKCDHSLEAKPAIKCIKSLLQTDNPQRYFVATQDQELRERVRKVPGVPVLYLHGNTPILEEPSSVSVETAQKLTENKTSYQMQVLRDLKLKEFGGETKVIKRKRKGGPNPLSCLKSKKVTKPDLNPTEEKKKRRKRRKRNNNKKGGTETTD